MSKKILSAIAVSLVIILVMFTFSSCFMTGTTTDTETETTVVVPTVTPAEAAKDIDLTKADPSTDDVKFSFDEEGRLIAIEYKSGDASYIASYNYRDGFVEVYLFGDATVCAFLKYKPSAEFNASLGFIEQDGFYFKGYKSLEKQEVVTTSAESESESSPESGTETAADSETK